MHMCVYKCICMCVCVYVYVHIHTYAHLYTCVYTYIVGCQGAITPVAVKFAPGKSRQFSDLFLRILLSEFRFTVFIPWAVQRIRKSPTAMLSQQKFLTNI